jgi:hypothetical protein
MRINRDEVFDFLKQKQDEFGGYTGRDITELTKKLLVSRVGLRKRIDHWAQTDQTFAELRYLGQHPTTTTLEDIFLINQCLKSNPLILKKDILDEVNSIRSFKGFVAVPKTTFYRAVRRCTKQLFSNVPHELKWLYANEIKISNEYNLPLARASLTNVFTFSELKNFGGVDIEGIYERFREAERWFYRMYIDTEPYFWYPRIKDRIKVFQNHVSSVKSDEVLPIQTRLIFESQIAFLVDCKDLLIEEIIHKGGRVQQNMNESRKKVENKLLKKWIEQYSAIGWSVVNNPNGNDLNKLKEMLENKKSFDDEVDLLLIKSHMKSLDFIYDCLDRHTNHFSNDKIVPHDPVAELILDICRGNRLWQSLSNDECLRITRNKTLIRELQLPKSTHTKAMLAKKLLKYLQSGKFTIHGSFKFQDFGRSIKSVILTDKDEFIKKEDLDMLINGNYPIEIPSEITQPCFLGEEEEGSEEKIPLQSVLEEVSSLITHHNPKWFENHKEVFKLMGDRMFRMEYDESKFKERFYQAIGFLGRNLRYNDSPEFHGLQYFIQRYVNDEALDLEFRHLWNVYRDLTGIKTSLILIDSMGIDSRRKSLFVKIHGRYRTIGFADIRAISCMLIPIFSSNFRSTDSEAMNISDIINHAYNLIGDDLKSCAGNSHTVSRMAAGLAFVNRKVILMGRNPYPPKKPSKTCIQRLKMNLDLLNKIGKLVREDGAYGRLIASRKHIFVDGVNVCNLLRDLGKLVLWNVGQYGFQLDNLIQLIETSNRQKRLVRIVERGVIRAHEPNVSLMLKASELILLMVGIMNLEREKIDIKTRSPVSMENIALYIPA